MKTAVTVLPIIGIFIIGLAYLYVKIPRAIVLSSKIEADIVSVSVTSTPSVTPTSTPTPTPTPSPLPTATPSPKPTTTPTPKPTPKPVKAPADLESFFVQYASQYSVDIELLKRIAYCESRFNPGATNRDYAGLYQFTKTLWINTRTQMGHDINPDLRINANEAIKTAAFLISKGKLFVWPNCAK